MYSLPSGYEAVTGEVIQASQHNPPLEDLESAMSARLMRSGVAPMTGALKITDGAVGSPAVQFSSNTSTGIYKTTNGIGVSVNGTKVAEFTSSGIGRMIGELIPYTGLTAPDGWVLAYGQTLSRTTYADLWTFAQAEIAAGNTLFNNGNGTTTFGIGDLRGRVVAASDVMGGPAAGRLTTTTMTSAGLGGTGGTQTVTLTTAEMPSHYHSANIGDPGHTHSLSNVASTVNAASRGSFFTGVGGSATTLYYDTPSLGGNYTGVYITSSNGDGNTFSAGLGGSHRNVQPTIICNYILYAGA